MDCNRKNNFSLVEILVVIAIIMVLFGITVGVFGLINDKIKASRTEAIVKQISAAMQSYRVDQGYYFINTNTFQSLGTAADPVNDANRFKFNFGGVIDTEFVKYFDYESLRGRGYIQPKPLGSNNAYIVDAWGRSLLYKCPGSINTSMFDIGSLGKDGMYGDNSSNPADFGKGDDITNFNY